MKIINKIINKFVQQNYNKTSILDVSNKCFEI